MMQEAALAMDNFATIRDRLTLPGLLAHTRLRVHCGAPDRHNLHEGWADYEGVRAAIQLVGGVTKASPSFYWGWALPGGLPTSLTRYSREFCERYMALLQEPVPEGGRMNFQDSGQIFVLAAIAAEYAGEGQRFDVWPVSDQITGFFLVNYPEPLPPLSVSELCGALQFTLQNLLPSHQKPLKAWLAQAGFRIGKIGHHWACEHPGGMSLTISFNEAGQVTQLTPMREPFRS